jgi:membrane protease YdiL (CAAX protease family)
MQMCILHLAISLLCGISYLLSRYVPGSGWLKVIDWILSLVIGLVVFAVVYAGAFSLTMILSKNTGLGRKFSENPWMTNLIVGPVVIAGSLVAILLLSQGSLSLWGLQFPSYQGILAVASLGSALAFITVLVAESISPSPSSIRPPSDAQGRIIFFLLIVVLASTSEELLFRGVLQNLLDNTRLIALNLGIFSLTSGAVVSGLVFAAVHAAPARKAGGSSAVLVGSALVLGVAAGISLAETTSLVAPIMVHALFNFLGFAIVVKRSVAAPSKSV